MLSDYLREWVREREVGGSFQKLHPFQAAICMNSLHESSLHAPENSLDSLVTTMLQSAGSSTSQPSAPDMSSSESLISIDMNSWTDEDIPAFLDRALPTQVPNRPFSLLQAASLANDILYNDSLKCDTGLDATSSPPRVQVQTRTVESQCDLVKPDEGRRAVPSTSTTQPIAPNLAALKSKYPTAKPIQQFRPPASVEPMEDSGDTSKVNPFKTAKQQLIQEGGSVPKSTTKTAASSVTSSGPKAIHAIDADVPPELAIFDKALLEKIEADIIHQGSTVSFDDIAGLEFAKKCVNELICWPMSRPDLFQGLRSLPRGLLLFGPPGTGKTLIGKAIASQVGATFFSISASSLTSKWIGEGEKTVRALFAIAAYRQPSVVFIDEVDSLLCQRSSDENEASRRIKTEFLVQLDGAGTSEDTRVVIVGATNRPEELDEAARRRFVKRIYIPLPDEAGRHQLLCRLLGPPGYRSDGRSTVSGTASRSTGGGGRAGVGLPSHDLDSDAVQTLVHRTAGFSGADIRSLCTEAAMGPMRELAMKHGDLRTIQAADVPAISVAHFMDAFDAVAPSVSPSDLQRYIDWNNIFGSFRRMV